jgi:Sigma 54 modulation/S30EA ribosomal protein C terminus
MGRTLRKFKERKDVRHQKTAPGTEDPAAFVALDAPEDSETDSDELEDSYASVPAQKSPVDGVVKRKVFPLPLQTVEEAILCLEYIDHSFYLVRPEPALR